MRIKSFKKRARVKIDHGPSKIPFLPALYHIRFRACGRQLLRQPGFPAEGGTRACTPVVPANACLRQAGLVGVSA